MTSEIQETRRGVVIVVSHESRLLVIRRSQLVVAPGAHCFPGGHIEPGETEEAALVREFREELNGDIMPRRIMWRSISARGVHLSWWSAKLRDPGQPLTPNPAEVEAAFWTSHVEMLALPNLLDSNRRFLEAVEQGAISGAEWR